jgi:hypothetical protein
MSDHAGQVGAGGVVKRGRGRPRKVPIAIPPPVAAPEPPARRGRGRPRLDADTRAAALDDRLSLAMLEARTAGVLGSGASAPAIRFDVSPGSMPDLSTFDLGMMADAMTAMISAGSSEAYGRRRAWETLRQVYDKRKDAERLRHVDAAHALLIHDGHRLALNDMSERRYAGAVLAARLDQIYTRCMDPEVFSRAAGVALKATTLRAKLHGIDVDSMKIELKAEVTVEHHDPIRDAIVQRLMQAKEAAQRANAAAIDVQADDADGG